MADLDKGITTGGSGYAGKTWNILGQVYFPKAVCDSTFAFETNSDPGQFVPVHIHPTQDEFILVQEGVLDLKLDGQWVKASAGDLVRLPRGIPHGYFNKSDKPARALFWVSPSRMLEELFNNLHNVADPAEVCHPRRTPELRLAAYEVGAACSASVMPVMTTTMPRISSSDGHSPRTSALVKAVTAGTSGMKSAARAGPRATLALA